MRRRSDRGRRCRPWRRSPWCRWTTRRSRGGWNGRAAPSWPSSWRPGSTPRSPKRGLAPPRATASLTAGPPTATVCSRWSRAAGRWATCGSRSTRTRPDSWWVYDVEVDEQARGRGLGRRLMELAEVEVARLGGTSIGLSVFGTNSRARRLYESLGYEPTSIRMRKRLE